MVAARIVTSRITTAVNRTGSRTINNLVERAKARSRKVVKMEATAKNSAANALSRSSFLGKSAREKSREGSSWRVRESSPNAARSRTWETPVPYAAGG